MRREQDNAEPGILEEQFTVSGENMEHVTAGKEQRRGLREIDRKRYEQEDAAFVSFFAVFPLSERQDQDDKGPEGAFFVGEAHKRLWSRSISGRPRSYFFATSPQSGC